MADYYPYLNRGAYKWIPDTYAATSESNFGVTSSYNLAVCNHGRHINMLAGEYANRAEATTVIYRGVTNGSGQWVSGSNDIQKLEPGDIGPPPIESPFARKIRRGTNLSLNAVPFPSVDQGFGFTSQNVLSDPFFFFSTDSFGTGRIASVDIEYMLATSNLWEESPDHSATNPPLAILAVFDSTMESSNSTWLGATKNISETSKWGPASDQIAQDGHVQSALSAVYSSGLGSGVLKAVYLPMYVSDGGVTTTYGELAITNQSAFKGSTPDWNISSRRQVNIKLSGTYWTNLEYFPKLLGFLIMPNWRVFEGVGAKGFSAQDPPHPWNSIISGIRVYDALQSNTVPEHTKITTTTVDGETQNNIETIPSQLPCEIFGYAWRISHSVMMSKHTNPVQPARGKLLTDDPGGGYGDRLSTFYFKIYHPDIDGLGISHGVRFYYGLAVAPIPGTAPGLNGSILGLMTSLVADFDLLQVAYMGPKAGTQTLTFKFGINQYGDVGRVIYAGQFGFAKETVGTRCGWVVDPSTSAPNVFADGLSWIGETSSWLPSQLNNGTKALFYDNDTSNTNDKWYAIASVNAFGVRQFDPEIFGTTYIGGLTPLIRGAPQTNIPGKGAFGMTVNSSSSFIGPEKLTVYTKPLQYAPGVDIKTICEDNQNHLATFVSEVRAIGNDVYIYGGTWRLRLAAAISSGLRMKSQIFFRFAFVPDKIHGKSIDLEKLNASSFWDLSNDYFEFHFKYDNGNYYIAPGPPSVNSVISTPFLNEQATSYELSWEAFFGEVGNYVSERNADDVFSKQMILHLGKAMPGMEGCRLVVQAWSACFPMASNLSSTSGYYSPSSDINYPVVEMSWSGETESMFQTMIIENKGNEIFAQQDPYVAGAAVIDYNYITFKSCEASKPTSQEAPYRDYPVWTNKVTPQNRLTPFSSGVGGHPGLATYGLLTEDGVPPSGGRLSITDFTVPEIADLTEDQAQIFDIAVSSSDNAASIIGGTTIGPNEFSVSFDYILNNSNFNIRYVIELLAAPSNGYITYPIAQSGLRTIDSSSNIDASLEFSGKEDFKINLGNSMVIPNADSKLMLRFKMWPNRNRESSSSFYDAVNKARQQSDFNAGFTSFDISNFSIIPENSIEIVVGPLLQRGSSDWYEGLSTTTDRTFGSDSYTFIADYDARTTQICVPATVSPEHGYFYLYGWMISPFWFLQMPEGSCIEMKDDAGLTLGSLTGVASARERAHRVLWVRTAIGTLPLASVSSDSENARMSGSGILARQRLEVSGAASATNFLSVVSQIQSEESVRRGLAENMVRSGDSIISGKNPLIITGSPDRTSAHRLYRGNISTSYLFYEEDSFDIDTHASVVMLANYDGTFARWNSPYGKRSSGNLDKVVFTNDMRLIGAAVDPMDFGIYMAGYRANDLNNPPKGGVIVLKKLVPGLVFGTDSAHVGPLIIVDGLVTEETYNVKALPSVQPVIPEADTIINQTTKKTSIVVPDSLSTNSGNRLNNLSDGKLPLPAAESFPDVIVDTSGNIYVFYTLLTSNQDEAKNALGKVFCRESHNAGYWFDMPFPVADLGYERAIQRNVNVSPNDSSFAAKHITAIYSDETKTYALFFWANGKIFMRLLPHPGIDLDRFKIVATNKGKDERISYNNNISMLYLVEGDTSFTDGRISSALDEWLKQQWDIGSELSDADRNKYLSEISADSWYNSNTSYSELSGKKNNFQAISNTNAPTISILKYANSEDIPAQRIGAVVNSDGDVLIYYLNSAGNVLYKRIRIFGNGPAITPALIVSINTL